MTKNRLLILLTVLFGTILNAQTVKTEAGSGCTECEGKPGAAKNPFEAIGKVADKMNEADSCDSPDSVNEGIKSLKKLIEQDKKDGVSAKEIFTEPTSRTANSVTYKFSERSLQPKENLYLAIPKDLQGRPVSFVTLGHRQDPKTDAGIDPKTGWDTKPGLTSVQIHGKNFPGKSGWRAWKGMSSGENGAKFAEPRDTLEMENLYEWQTHGSLGADNGDYSKVGILGDGIRVRSVGKDEVKVGELSVKFAPAKPTVKIENIFTEGSVFNEEVGETAAFGGGQKYNGKFPGALELNTSNASSRKLPDGWQVVGRNTLSIPLPVGKVLTSIEVLGGDSHPDEKKNKDGGFGTPGWAKASIGIESEGKTDWILESENVPPEGILIGTPRECKKIVKVGDRVLIRAVGDAYYIMGVRIGLIDK